MLGASNSQDLGGSHQNGGKADAVRYGAQTLLVGAPRDPNQWKRF